VAAKFELEIAKTRMSWNIDIWLYIVTVRVGNSGNLTVVWKALKYIRG